MSKKYTWTSIMTTGLFNGCDDDGFMTRGDRLGDLLRRELCPPLRRQDDPPEAEGFVPYHDPMGEHFVPVGRSGKLWRWYHRLDRISLPGPAIKLLAEKFLRDGCPGLSEGMQLMMNDARTDKDRLKIAIDHVRQGMLATAPVAITLTPVYFEPETGMVRVMARHGSRAHKFVCNWLGTIADDLKARGLSDVATGHFEPSPAFRLMCRFGRLPMRLLGAIPGEFDDSEGDGDQTELDPNDVYGIMSRLSHFARDLPTWLAYRAVSSRSLVNVPAVVPHEEPYSIALETMGSVSVFRAGGGTTTDICASDPLADDALSAALRAGGKISALDLVLMVSYPNGSERRFAVCMTPSMFMDAVELPVFLEPDHSMSYLEELWEAMSDAEGLLQRLLCAFAVLRSGPIWPIEKAAMLSDLYRGEEYEHPGMNAEIGAGDAFVPDQCSPVSLSELVAAMRPAPRLTGDDDAEGDDDEDEGHDSEPNDAPPTSLTGALQRFHDACDGMEVTIESATPDGEHHSVTIDRRKKGGVN